MTTIENREGVAGKKILRGQKAEKYLYIPRAMVMDHNGWVTETKNIGFFTTPERAWDALVEYFTDTDPTKNETTALKLSADRKYIHFYNPEYGSSGSYGDAGYVERSVCNQRLNRTCVFCPASENLQGLRDHPFPRFDSKWAGSSMSCPFQSPAILALQRKYACSHAACS